MLRLLGREKYKSHMGNISQPNYMIYCNYFPKCNLLLNGDLSAALLKCLLFQCTFTGVIKGKPHAKTLCHAYFAFLFPGVFPETNFH